MNPRSDAGSNSQSVTSVECDITAIIELSINLRQTLAKRAHYLYC
jgi:hypothetical protein